MIWILIPNCIQDSCDEIVEIQPRNFESRATGLDALQLEHLIEGLVQSFGVLIDVARSRPYLVQVESV